MGRTAAGVRAMRLAEGDELVDMLVVNPEYDIFTLTSKGYGKRTSVEDYRLQGRGGMGVTAHRPKDEDYVEKMFICSTHDDILLFSSLGKVYSVKGYEIPEANRTARGRAVVNIVRLDQGEKIESVLPVKEGDGGYIVIATKKGVIKKTTTKEYERIPKNGKIAIRMQEGDELISVQFTTGENEIIVASR